MSISPIIFLIGVHSHGTPDKPKMWGITTLLSLLVVDILTNAAYLTFKNSDKLNNIV